MPDLTGEQHGLIDHFTRGFAGVFDATQLLRLAEACERDDPRLMQCATVFPPVTESNMTLPWERCCAASFAATEGETVEDVHKGFNSLCGFLETGGWDKSHPRWMYVLAWDRLPRSQALAATAVACRALLAERERVGTRGEASQ